MLQLIRVSTENLFHLVATLSAKDRLCCFLHDGGLAIDGIGNDKLLVAVMTDQHQGN